MNYKGLLEMLSDVKAHKTDRDRILEKFVSERLEKSLNTYENELRLSLDYLERRKDTIKLAKKINKL